MNDMKTAPFPPLGSTADRIAELISKRILRREFVIGQRLIEADLMCDFGVGRSTVREALKILAASGVVELIHNRGAVIGSLSAEDADDLLRVLEILSGLGARLAAEKIDQGTNRARFEAAAKLLIDDASFQELEHILDQRAKYYQVMFDIAGNKELDRVMPLPRVHLFRMQFFRFLTKSDVKAMIGEYRGVSAAILAGNPSQAEARMRRHIRKTAERTLPRYRSERYQ